MVRLAVLEALDDGVLDRLAHGLRADRPAARRGRDVGRAQAVVQHPAVVGFQLAGIFIVGDEGGVLVKAPEQVNAEINRGARDRREVF